MDSKSTQLLSLVFISVLLSGCAALTVDVDVYKGPLANEEDVQIQSLVVLAHSARPMLLQLRNTIECREIKSNEPEKRKKLNREEFYSRFCELGGNRNEEWLQEFGGYEFLDPLARRVHAVLSLYDNADDSERHEDALMASAQWKHIERIIEDYQKVLDGYAPDETRDRQRWKEFGALLASPEEITEKTDFSLFEADGEFKERVRKLQAAYQSFLCPDCSDSDGEVPKYRTARKIIDKSDSLIRYLNDKNGALVGKFGLRLINQGDCPPINKGDCPPINKVFNTLSDSKYLNSHRHFLLKNPEDMRSWREASDSVTSLAKQFVSARELIAHGIVEGLRYLELVNAPGAQMSTGIRTEVTLATAQVLTIAIQPRHLYEAACDDDAPSNVSVFLRRELYIADCENTAPVTQNRKWSKRDYPVANERIINVIRKYPVPTAKAILAAHNYLMQKGVADYSTGIARAPFVTDDDDVELASKQLNKMRDAFQQAKFETGLGLERGRLPVGLDTLVENYLSSRCLAPLEAADDLCTETKKREQQLLDALVRFAQKVLFLANNVRIFEFEDLDDSEERFVRTLQAVGNSILVQTNEVKARRSYREESERRVRYTKSPYEAMRELEQSPEFVLNRFEAYLESQRKPAAEVGDEDDSDVGLALAELRKLRSGMVEKVGAHQGHAVISLLVSELDKQTAGLQAGQGNHKAREKALKKVRKLALDFQRVPIGLYGVEFDKRFGESGGNEIKDPKYIWELVSNTLRMQLLTVAPGSQLASNIKSSIQLADEYQSGRVYIRPAVSYLRTSFPATALQGKNKDFTENMLTPGFLRRDGADDSANRVQAKVNSEVDKQYWQNINRVHVRGTGNTNYAITKDDLGNWYVKQYSADPTIIYQSLQRAALYALGDRMNVNLLKQLPAPNAAAPPNAVLSDPSDNAGAPPGNGGQGGGNTTQGNTNQNVGTGAAVGGNPALEGQIERFKGRYAEEGEIDLQAIKTDATNLPDTIRAAWQRLDLNENESAAIEQALADTGQVAVVADEASSDPDKVHETVVLQLTHFLDYQRNLDANLQGKSSGGVDELVRTIQKQQTELADKRAALDASGAEIRMLQGQLQELEDEENAVRNLKQGLQGLAVEDDGKDNLRDLIDEQDTKLAKLNVRQEDIQEKIDEESKRGDELASRIESLEGSLSTDRERLENLLVDRKAITEARRVARETINAKFSRTLAQRKRAIDGYRSALTIIGDSTQAANP